MEQFVMVIDGILLLKLHEFKKSQDHVAFSQSANIGKITT